ncbi:hypothetical protein ACP87_03625 [Pseudomonas oleovorans]|nr:hypothetical protein [Pseudomonas oleovorans]MBN7132929.1 hypothetical protein [Pseudomonas oleovorans]MBN7139155.1 hypothetical protein [Pseudomonas oleovorans]
MCTCNAFPYDRKIVFGIPNSVGITDHDNILHRRIGLALFIFWDQIGLQRDIEKLATSFLYLIQQWTYQKRCKIDVWIRMFDTLVLEV